MFTNDDQCPGFRDGADVTAPLSGRERTTPGRPGECLAGPAGNQANDPDVLSANDPGTPGHAQRHLDPSDLGARALATRSSTDS
jgi:hypothetical protein